MKTVNDEPIITFDTIMKYLSNLFAGIGILCTFLAIAFLLGYFTSPSQI